MNTIYEWEPGSAPIATDHGHEYRDVAIAIAYGFASAIVERLFIEGKRCRIQLEALPRGGSTGEGLVIRVVHLNDILARWIVR